MLQGQWLHQAVFLCAVQPPVAGLERWDHAVCGLGGGWNPGPSDAEWSSPALEPPFIRGRLPEERLCRGTCSRPERGAKLSMLGAGCKQLGGQGAGKIAERELAVKGSEGTGWPKTEAPADLTFTTGFPV